MRDAYVAIAQSRLLKNEEFIDGLNELLYEPDLEPYRSEVVLDFLERFPNAIPGRLSDLLDAVVSLSAAHPEFLQLARPIVSGVACIEQRQEDLWLIMAYVVAPSQFENEVKHRTTLRRDLIFDLRDRAGFARRTQPDHGLLLPMLEFMAQLTGALLPNTPPPTGGAWGDTNAWNAAEHFRNLTNMISASPSSRGLQFT